MKKFIKINFVLFTLLFGCQKADPITVTGKITYIQESMGWETPIHTVIKQENNKIIRICGVWGSIGDSVTVTAKEYK